VSDDVSFGRAPWPYPTAAISLSRVPEQSRVNAFVPIGKQMLAKRAFYKTFLCLALNVNQ
jgi:hypothetical protein